MMCVRTTVTIIVILAVPIGTAIGAQQGSRSPAALRASVKLSKSNYYVGELIPITVLVNGVEQGENVSIVPPKGGDTDLTFELYEPWTEPDRTTKSNKAGTFEYQILASASRPGRLNLPPIRVQVGGRSVATTR